MLSADGVGESEALLLPKIRVQRDQEPSSSPQVQDPDDERYSGPAFDRAHPPLAKHFERHQPPRSSVFALARGTLSIAAMGAIALLFLDSNAMLPFLGVSVAVGYLAQARAWRIAVWKHESICLYLSHRIAYTLPLQRVFDAVGRYAFDPESPGYNEPGSVSTWGPFNAQLDALGAEEPPLSAVQRDAA